MSKGFLIFRAWLGSVCGTSFTPILRQTRDDTLVGCACTGFYRGVWGVPACRAWFFGRNMQGRVWCLQTLLGGREAGENGENASTVRRVASYGAETASDRSTCCGHGSHRMVMVPEHSRSLLNRGREPAWLLVRLLACHVACPCFVSRRGDGVGVCHSVDWR